MSSKQIILLLVLDMQTIQARAQLKKINKNLLAKKLDQLALTLKY